MKKTSVFIFLLAALLAFSACGSPAARENTPAAPEIFYLSGVYTISLDGKAYTAQINADSDGVVLELQKPEALQGYTLRYSGAELLFDVCGLTSAVGQENLPDISPAGNLCKLLYACILGKHAPDGDGYQTDTAAFQVDANGKIVRITTEECRIEIMSDL
ncbi:MAG: hypothetical protein IJ766_08440 [Clostridia bacterium]|nr:hypothetical protein [Clostridia bacterium]